MGLDTTVSNPNPSTPPCFLPPPPSLEPMTPHRSRDQDECFACRELGHWSADCPNKTSKRSPSSTPGSSTNASDFPVVRCPCDSGVCIVRTSSTSYNPNRKFYACPVDKSKGKQCGFFKWCDEIKGVPVCACGVGTCSLNRTSTGPDEGRWYFACRIKKNHGACDFFQWADNELSSILNKTKGEKKGHTSGQPNFNAGNNDLGNEELDSNYPINVLQSNQGEVPNEDLIVQNVASSNPMMGNELQVYQSKPIPETGSHSLRELRRNTSDAGITIREGLISVDFISTLPWNNGQKSSCCHVFCCIFPSINPVVDAEDADMSGVEPRQDVQVFGGFRLEPLVLKNPSARKQGNDGLWNSVFKKLAQSLFDILEDIGPHDPEPMLKVAEAIFSSLQMLSIDCGPFILAVKDYIHNLSKLTSIEGSMHNRPSSQQLISLSENEKARLKNISHHHSEALAAYRAAESHRQSLQEEILKAKGVLIQLEEQLLCCEAETSAHKAQFDDASKEMLESEKSIKDVAFNLAEAIELEQQRELVSNAARAAFEAAMVWLEK